MSSKFNTPHARRALPAFRRLPRPHLIHHARIATVRSRYRRAARQDAKPRQIAGDQVVTHMLQRLPSRGCNIVSNICAELLDHHGLQSLSFFSVIVVVELMACPCSDW